MFRQRHARRRGGSAGRKDRAQDDEHEADRDTQGQRLAENRDPECERYRGVQIRDDRRARRPDFANEREEHDKSDRRAYHPKHRDGANDRGRRKARWQLRDADRRVHHGGDGQRRDDHAKRRKRRQLSRDDGRPGRVAHGVVEIMNLMEVVEVEPDELLGKNFSYPVYTQLKGADLYEHKVNKRYSREDFHLHPEEYQCKFLRYTSQSDILMNGVYWEKDVPRLFEKTDAQKQNFRIQTIADIADDMGGSIPVNLGDQSIEEPVYGVSRKTLEKTAPYLPGSIDIMAVGNLPNELPRDASRYFGEQLIKYVLPNILSGGSEIIEKATIVRNGKLTEHFKYLKDYVEGAMSNE